MKVELKCIIFVSICVMCSRPPRRLKFCNCTYRAHDAPECTPNVYVFCSMLDEIFVIKNLLKYHSVERCLCIYYNDLWISKSYIYFVNVARGSHLLLFAVVSYSYLLLLCSLLSTVSIQIRYTCKVFDVTMEYFAIYK